MLPAGVGLPVGLGLPVGVGLPVGLGLPVGVGVPLGLGLPVGVGVPLGLGLPAGLGVAGPGLPAGPGVAGEVRCSGGCPRPPRRGWPPGKPVSSESAWPLPGTLTLPLAPAGRRAATTTTTLPDGTRPVGCRARTLPGDRS